MSVLGSDEASTTIALTSIAPETSPSSLSSTEKDAARFGSEARSTTKCLDVTQRAEAMGGAEARRGCPSLAATRRPSGAGNSALQAPARAERTSRERGARTARGTGAHDVDMTCGSLLV